MNTRYKPGDYEARHLEPVWRSRANFIITADIGETAERREWEQLWAKQIGDRRFEICCIPFFVYDLALGDEVETDSDHIIRQVSRRSGHVTFRVWFGNSSDKTIRDETVAIVRESGGEHEWSSNNLLAIDAVSPEAVQAIADFLNAQHCRNRLTYETGRST
jgi:Domain of unknown function (DUF4265)